jgi:hypothetical protein
MKLALGRLRNAGAALQVGAEGLDAREFHGKVEWQARILSK